MKTNTNRIPNTVREYTKAIRHGAATIFRTRYGWQIPVNDGEFHLDTKPTLEKAKSFIEAIAAEGRDHIFA